jgi:hypothetical protein
MLLLTKRGQRLSEQQMQIQASLRRRLDPQTPSASGGQASGFAAAVPIKLRMATANLSELAQLASLMAKAPEGLIRVPLGTGLSEGDQIDLPDGSIIEVLTGDKVGTYDPDERAYIATIT